MNIYGVLIGFGVILIIASIEKFFQNKIKFYDYIFLSLSALFCARLAFIIHHIPLLLEDWLSFFKIFQGGLSIHGALIGIALATFVITKREKIPFLSFTDSIVLNLPIAQSLGRLGNFFNQELYGTQTNLPWGIKIQNEFENIKFHPLFAYEIILNIINWIILRTLFRKFNISQGILTPTYLLNYGIIRLITNRFRLDKTFILGIETSDFISSILILIGCILLIHMLLTQEMQKKIANIISKVLNPFLLISIPFFLIAFQKNLFATEPIHITVILVIAILAPILQFHIFKNLGLVNDWDISDRTKRPLFTAIAATIFFLLFLISLISVSTEIKVITLSLTITTYTFAIISIMWKISGHLTFLSFTILSLYLLTKSPIFIYILFPMLILVSWTRVKLEQHDIWQTIGGGLLGIGVIVFIWILATQPLPF